MSSVRLNIRFKEKHALPKRCKAFTVMFAAHRGQDQAARLIEILGRREFDHGKIFLMPRSSHDIAAQGFVWISTDKNSDATCPADAIALRLVCDQPSRQLWIPQESELVPKIDTDAIKSLIPSSELVRVWLPNLGLVGFADDDQIDCQHLLQVPERKIDCDWAKPPEVWSPPQRLHELTMLEPPSADSFLKDVQKELGLPHQSLLETSDDGISQEKRGAGQNLKNWFLGKMDKYFGRKETDNKPQPNAGKAAAGKGLARSALGKVSGAIGGMFALPAGAIAAPLAAAMARMMQGGRDREIEKLLRMFRSNPDEALKFAIPMGGLTDAFRGFAMPGSALLRRLTDFSLAGLSSMGGGLVDLWSINPNLQVKLMQQYREQANRELAAGRYRRAAYIFAHLLADFRAAAQSLEKGKFYAEAAVLHRDKLNSRDDAARCLSLAGQYQEAAELYVKVNQYEKAGEVWLAADMPDKAKDMFWTAHRDFLRKGAVISAAKILESRLELRGDAIVLLRKQWPTGNDTLSASKLAIEWMGEDGEHDQTKDFVQEILSDAQPHQLDDVAHIMSDACARYPDSGVRMLAEDQCRLATSRVLAEGAPMQKDSVLSTLAALRRKDSQLRNDVNGWRSRAPQSKASANVPTGKRRNLVALDAIELPQGAYLDFYSNHYQMVALRLSDGELTLLRSVDYRKLPFEKVFSERISQAGVELFHPIVLMVCISSNNDFFLVRAPCSNYSGGSGLEGSGKPVKWELEPVGDTIAIASRNRRTWEIRRHDDSYVLASGHGHTYDLRSTDEESKRYFSDRVDKILHTPAGALEVENPQITIVNDEPIVAREGRIIALKNGRLVELE